MQITLLVWLACAALSTQIFRSKNRSPFAGFLLGFCFGVIGLIIALCLNDKIDPYRPPGWYACPYTTNLLRWWDGRQWTPSEKPKA